MKDRKRCKSCLGKLGLVAHNCNGYRFCCLSCKSAYQKQWQEDSRIWQMLQWQHLKPP